MIEQISSKAVYGKERHMEKKDKTRYFRQRSHPIEAEHRVRLCHDAHFAICVPLRLSDHSSIGHAAQPYRLPAFLVPS